MLALVCGIGRHKASRAPMEYLYKVTVSLDSGLEGDFRGSRERKEGKRQVTLISLEQWQEACLEVGSKLPWLERRANICLSGIKFGPQDVGRTLRFNQGLVLEIAGEAKPCERMDDLKAGLKEALSKDWRGGVSCRVLSEGTIEIGDEVH